MHARQAPNNHASKPLGRVNVAQLERSCAAFQRRQAQQEHNAAGVAMAPSLSKPSEAYLKAQKTLKKVASISKQFEKAIQQLQRESAAAQDEADARELASLAQGVAELNSETIGHTAILARLTAASASFAAATTQTAGPSTRLTPASAKPSTGGSLKSSEGSWGLGGALGGSGPIGDTQAGTGMQHARSQKGTAALKPGTMQHDPAMRCDTGVRRGPRRVILPALF